MQSLTHCTNQVRLTAKLFGVLTDGPSNKAMLKDWETAIQLASSIRCPGSLLMLGTPLQQRLMLVGTAANGQGMTS